MSSYLKPSPLLAVHCASLLPLASATNSACYDPDFSTVNATGSVQIPALWHDSESPNVTNSTWTISTGVKEFVVQYSNEADFVQKWWLDIDPVITTSPSQLSFTGCAFLLELNVPSSALLGSTDGNTCNGILDNACYKAIIDVVNSNVTSLAAKNVSSVCSSLLSGLIYSVPSQCKNSGWGWAIGRREYPQSSFPGPATVYSYSCTDNACFPIEPFGNPNFTGADVSSTSCLGNEINPLNGSATQAALISRNHGSAPTGNKTYDIQTIENINPLVLTTFPKNSSQVWTPNTQVVCVKADNFTAGSEMPNQAGSTVSALTMTLGLLLPAVAAWSLC